VLNDSDRCIVFTICSNNYLAQAKTLLNAVLITNPGVRFYIGLADKKQEIIDYTFLEPAVVIELSDQIIPGYDNMISRYNIIELNTAVKPFFFQFLIRNNPAVSFLYYFDPDIMVYTSLQYLHNLLGGHDIIVTPHFYTPLPIDEYYPKESMALKYGVYNLGFIGIKADGEQTAGFLKWWGERTFTYGYDNNAQGLFVDQIWITLAPLFFKRLGIINHHGCNMGPWNLHERQIAEFTEDKNIKLNNGEDLMFYHFSSYRYKDPFKLSESYNRHDLTRLPLLKLLYQDYHAQMLANKVHFFSAIKCALPLHDMQPRLKHKVAAPVLNLVRKIWRKI
jgi:hypothetical protein